MGLPMIRPSQVVVFALDERRFALRLSSVERAVRAVEVTPLPKAPAVILGVIDVQGSIIPVFDVRRRFRLPDKAVGLDDHIIIVHTAQRSVALVVDSVAGVMEFAEEEAVPPQAIVPGIEYVAGIVKRPDGMVFIHDLDQFLAMDEARQLEGVLSS